MRISDWSSDVCCSDLVRRHAGSGALRRNAGADLRRDCRKRQNDQGSGATDRAEQELAYHRTILRGDRRESRSRKDRKSVVEGKSGSVRVDLGGRRIIKKKNTKSTTIDIKTIQK